MKEGWISIHRKLQDCDIWLAEEPFDRRSAWIDLLMSANHKDNTKLFDGHQIVIKRGQYLTSVRQLAIRWGWGKDKVLKYLRLLEEMEMIVRDADSRRTLLTIVNYDFYQSEDGRYQTVDRQLADSVQTVSRHQSATNNNVKNDKNENNGNNNIPKPQKHKYGEYNHVLLTDAERDKLFDEYGELETTRAITFLDEYIEMKGYKAKSHYLCMRKWVFKALKEQNQRNNVQSRNPFDVLAEV